MNEADLRPLSLLERLALWTASIPLWLYEGQVSLILAGGVERHHARADILPSIRDALTHSARSAESAPAGIYAVSAARHAPLWERLREDGWPVVSTWHTPGDRPNRHAADSDGWIRPLAECHRARAIVIYRDEADDVHEVLRTVGPALLAILLAGRTRILFVDPTGQREAIFRHPSVEECASIRHAEVVLRAAGVFATPEAPVITDAVLSMIAERAQRCFQRDVAELHVHDRDLGRDLPHEPADHVTSAGSATILALVSHAQALRVMVLRGLCDRMWSVEPVTDHERFAQPPSEYGWAVFGTGSGYQIQADADCERFMLGADAWDNLAQLDCVRRAVGGDAHACRVLEFLKANDSNEYEAALKGYVDAAS